MLTNDYQISAMCHPRFSDLVTALSSDEYHSMTTLLTYTVAHSTKPSFRPKTNNQPLKKFLSLALS